MEIIKAIMKSFEKGTAINPGDDKENPYRFCEVSLFGVLTDTGKSMNEENTVTHIYDLLQQDKNVYILQKNGSPSRGKSKQDLIDALKKVDPNIYAPLADNIVTLEEERVFSRRKLPFIKIKKTRN